VRSLTKKTNATIMQSQGETTNPDSEQQRVYSTMELTDTHLSPIRQNPTLIMGYVEVAGMRALHLALPFYMPP
jgi:hypothetical protein